MFEAKNYGHETIVCYRAEVLTPASYHEDDYPFFYNNIKENVAKRIATYKKSAK